MDFTSVSFIFFLGVSLAVYYAVDKPSWRRWALAAANLGFFLLCGIKFSLCCLAVLAFSYGMALTAERSAKRQTVARISAVAVLLLLVVMKYLDFVLSWFGSFRLGLVAPVGISFYTLTCIGYLLDVGKGAAAERDFVKFFCFAGSFYTVISGPIGRSEQLSLYDSLPSLDEQRFYRGTLRILWGMFQKLVVANSLGTGVDYFFKIYSQTDPLRLLVACVFYSLQLYCDFAGYSDIVLGAAALFGIELPDNFSRPYLAVNMQDFWRRWHISLTSWFRQYVYFPLGGSRCSLIRTAVNTLIVFAVSGIWHGAGFNFAVWGLLHGAALAIRRLITKRKKGEKKVHSKPVAILIRIAQFLWVFGFSTLAWIFFRSTSLQMAVDIIWKFKYIREFPTYLFSTMELPTGKMLSTYLGLLAVVVRDIITECGIDLREVICKRPFVRTMVFLLLFAVIAFCGCFGASGFLYYAF